MATSKKVKSKSVKAVKKTASTKKNASAVKISPSTKILFVADRPKGRSKDSPKSKTLALVKAAKKGITLKALQAKVEADELFDATKAAKWLTTLAKHGLVELRA